MSKHDVAPNTERTCRLCGRTGKQRFHVDAPRAKNPWVCDNTKRCEIRQAAKPASKPKGRTKATAPKAKKSAKRASTRKSTAARKR